MKLSQLIDELRVLQNEHGDLEVKFSYNYGDYWKTRVAADIDAAELRVVKWSDYHRMDKIIDPDDCEEETVDEEGNKIEDADIKQVVVLS